MEIYLYPVEWLKVPMEIRVKLKEVFNIPRSKGTVIEDNRVMSDGHTIEDLQAVTIEKMQNYLDSEETDFVQLFNKCVQRIEDEIEPEIAEEPDERQIILDQWAVGLNRLKADAASRDMSIELQTLIRNLFPKPINNNVDETQKRRYKSKKAK